MVKAVERFVVVAPIPGRPMAFGGTVLETLSNGQVVESALAEIPIEQLGEWVESLNAVAIADNLRLQAELSAMTAERDSLATEKATLTTERDSLLAEKTLFVVEKHSLQTQFSELQTVNSQLTTQVMDCQAQLDTALAKIAEYEAKEAEPVATMGQVRKWLIMNYGPEITSQVNKLLSEIQDPIERACAISDWEYANIMLRTNPLVTTLANALGMDEEQTNAAYLAASQLP